jgi:DNA-directed RNA polymerase specialized sigma24 family protein
MWELSHWTFDEPNVQTRMININAASGRQLLTPKNEQADNTDALRRFGQAVVRDNWLVCDERSARALVDNLMRRAALAFRNGEGASIDDPRLRLFSLFIRLYRRHVRMAAIEEGVGEAAARGPSGGADVRDGGSSVERAVRNLPLDLRESLLLVVLERLSHVEAAEALDISLAALIDRLTRARAMLAASHSERPVVSVGHSSDRPQRRSAPYLRLVK